MDPASTNCAAHTPTVLQYVGYDTDRGGMMAALRALAGGGGFTSILGVGPGFNPRNGELATMTLPAVKAETLGPRTWWRSRFVARTVRTWLDGGRDRIFHAHSRAGLVTSLWLRRWGTPRVLATVHCLGRQRWFYRYAARRLRGNLYWLSPAMKRHYGIKGRDWENCLSDCVPSTAWRESRTMPRVSGRVTFGCAGALVPVKEWELLIEAMRRVPASENITIVHAGADDGTAVSVRYAAKLRDLAKHAGVAARFQWRGQVREMDGFYSEIDCLIVASPWEAFSMAALEAGAAGVPVLAADTAGTRDLIETANLGWLFSAGSSEALGAAIQEIAGGDKLAQWRRNEPALRRFLAPEVAAKHAAIYRALITA